MQALNTTFTYARIMHAYQREKNEQTHIAVIGYTGSLVIEKRAPVDQRKPNGKWLTVEKIELDDGQTDDLLAMLPQAMLARQRALESKRHGSDVCFAGDL